MTLDELTTRTRELFGACQGLLVQKNADYSKDDDVHANFREVAALCKDLDIDVRTPVGCIQFFILMKTHRQFKLIRDGKKPSNEGLFDSTVDKLNYEILLETLLEE